MASTISAASLTVTVSESITLNGYERGSSNSTTIASVTEVINRIVTATTTESTLISFGAAAAKGQGITGDVKYLRITNKDNANHVIVNFVGSSSDEAAIKLDKGCTILLFGDTADGLTGTMTMSNAAITIATAMTPGNLTAINVIANGADCDLELMVAST